MMKIGITGGIGSGKTTVCHFFEKILQVPVYYSDLKSKELLQTNIELKTQIAKHFGENIFDHSGDIDRKKLAEIVFNDADQLAILNSFIHPKVEEDFLQWSLLHQHKLYILKEAALLFESGSYKNLDLIVTVSADENLRIKRVVARDSTNEDAVQARINKQWSEDQRRSMSDAVIMNNDQELLIPQLLVLHQHWQDMKKA